MAHSIALCLLLKEAYDIDLAANRWEAQRQRNHETLPPKDESQNTASDEYLNTYRLNRDLIQKLEIEITNYLADTKRKGKGLSNRIKLLCTLSFFASGSNQKIVGENIYANISQPSISRSVNDIASTLCHPHIVKKYIKFPQNATQREVLKEQFFEKFKIPGVVGCIGGSYVTMIRPKDNEDRYYCRKGNHARNIQLIVDANLNILHVDASFGGATEDSFIFNYSEIKSHLEHLTNSGEIVCLLGDSQYPQYPYMMTPILGAEKNSPEEYYNELHATALSTIEKAFSVLKGRFRCLLVNRILHYQPDTVAKIVIACCVLHNICNRAGLAAVEMSQDEVDEEHRFINNVHRRQSVDQPSDTDAGLLARHHLANVLWHSKT